VCDLQRLSPHGRKGADAKEGIICFRSVGVTSGAPGCMMACLSSEKQPCARLRAGAVALARSTAIWACIAAYGCEGTPKRSLADQSCPFPGGLFLNIQPRGAPRFFAFVDRVLSFPCVAWTGLYYRCAANGIKRCVCIDCCPAALCYLLLPATSARSPQGGQDCCHATTGAFPLYLAAYTTR
jgi:hypothetical protein